MDLSILRQFETVFIGLANRVKPTVVSIRAESRIKSSGRRPGKGIPQPNVPRFSSGSGVIIDAEGYILTNNHVGADSSRLRVRLSDKSEYQAKVVGADRYTDLALIKIEPRGPLPVAKLGDSDKVKVGQWAIAVGDPFGITRTFTVGVVSGIGRSGVGIARYEHFIQTDAAINRGNSGGPLVNIEGEVIGINTAIPSPGSGIGFAIPSNMASEVIRHLRRKGSFARGYLGVMIQPVANDMTPLLGLPSAEGALVGRLLPDGPAQSAGIRAGDVIVGLDGRKVLDTAHLQKIVGWTPPGQPVDIQIVRDGKKEHLSVTLARLPDRRGEEKASPKEEPAKDEAYGMNLEGLTPELAKKNQLKSAEGVLIGEVKPGSQAFRDGLRSGMAIRQVTYRAAGDGGVPVRVPIRTLEDFERLLEKIPADTNVLAKIARGSGQGEQVRFLVLHSVRTR
ncbi:MAG: trypsin-like peptidase domain-containing protein [bacterium]